MTDLTEFLPGADRVPGKTDPEVRANFEEREDQRRRDKSATVRVVDSIKARAMTEAGEIFDGRGALDGPALPNPFDVIGKLTKRVRGTARQFY